MIKPSSHFIYEKIADDLRSRIENKEFANDRLPSERELAKHYDVNRITLRKAIDMLEQEKLISRDGTRGTFIGRRRARKSGNLVIGFVLVGRSRIDQIHSVTIMELEQQLKQYNSHMMLFSISDEDEIDDVLATPAGNGLLDAVIITGLVSPRIAQKIGELGLPTILFGHLMYQSPVEKSFDRVFPDSLDYSYQAVKYLGDKGHKKIALINGPGYQWFLNIYQGYMRALDELDLEYDEILVEKCVQDTLVQGIRAMSNLLKRECPNAVFVANERLGLGVVECLKTRGIKYPEDIEIITVGTDHSELPGSEKVETVVICWKSMIESALEMLFSRINEPTLPPRSKAVPFRIICPTHELKTLVHV
ncbi:MAG: GntR family transcriptional regulator [Victivallaceae bacterium]|nr:GntR family transcriptional regulator [Victivallaceae bacterium]